jgi:hypothetical protein
MILYVMMVMTMTLSGVIYFSQDSYGAAADPKQMYVMAFLCFLLSCVILSPLGLMLMVIRR